jgi:hypothetical protein
MPETKLHHAARDGDRNEIEALLGDGLAVNEKGAQGALRALVSWPFNLAVAAFPPLTARACSRAGRTALHRALGGGFIDCAEFLIENGADPDMADTLKRTALHWAAMGPPPGLPSVALPENARAMHQCCQSGIEAASTPITSLVLPRQPSSDTSSQACSRPCLLPQGMWTAANSSSTRGMAIR